MPKMTAGQKRINTAAIAGAGIFVLLVVFGYLPIKSAVANLQGQIDETQRKIREIETIDNELKGLEAGVQVLEAKRRELSSRFPEKEEEAFNIITAIAETHHINVKTLQAKAKVQFKGEGGKVFEAEGRSFHELGIAMTIEATYRNFVEYLEDLKNSERIFITVDNMNIIGGEAKREGEPLNININLKLYLLSK